MYADEYLGYKGYIARILREIGAEVGDKIRISTEKRIFEGILMPREALYGEKPFIIIKLDNGYNIGIRISGKEKIEVLEKREKRTVKTQVFRKQKKDLPRIVLLSTGGTIVSKVDYETGAVKPALRNNFV